MAGKDRETLKRSRRADRKKEHAQIRPGAQRPRLNESCHNCQEHAARCKIWTSARICSLKTERCVKEYRQVSIAVHAAESTALYSWFPAVPHRRRASVVAGHAVSCSRRDENWCAKVAVTLLVQGPRLWALENLHEVGLLKLGVIAIIEAGHACARSARLACACHRIDAS